MPPEKAASGAWCIEPGSLAIVLLALLRILPALFGSKTCRKFGLGAVLTELRSQIPDNGVGPVIAERRGAVLFLEENCRQCGRCRFSKDICQED
jgi:hypothetical protein